MRHILTKIQLVHYQATTSALPIKFNFKSNTILAVQVLVIIKIFQKRYVTVLKVVLTSFPILEYLASLTDMVPIVCECKIFYDIAVNVKLVSLEIIALYRREIVCFAKLTKAI